MLLSDAAPWLEPALAVLAVLGLVWWISRQTGPLARLGAEKRQRRAQRAGHERRNQSDAARPG